MRQSSSENLKAVVEWKTTGKRHRGRPKKRWMDGIRQDFEKLGITNLKEKVNNRKEWKEVTVVAKILEEL